MAHNKIFLAGREFQSLNAAKRHAKSLLDKYNYGDSIKDDDAAFLKAAIALRGKDKLMEKAGVGVESIFIDRNRGGDKAFYIRRIDGSECDFSYIKCFARPSALSDFSAACRNAIKEDKADLKAGMGFDCCDVHHKDIGFKEIVQAFIEARHIDITTIEFLTGDGVEGRYFADARLAADFRAFHSKWATMEVLSKSDHKRKHMQKSHTVNESKQA